MNHRATLSSPALPTLSEHNSASPGGDAAAKPKVLRRPAQFSQPAATRGEPAFLTDTRLTPGTPTPASPLIPPTRGWQDDGRFAFALLGIVIGINILLSLWLSPQPAVTSIAADAPTALPVAPPPSLIESLSEASASVSEQ